MRTSNYNNGYLRIYKQKENTTDFGAKKNIKTINDMVLIVKLAYEECSKRQQDFDFAESKNRILSLKVKTRMYKDISNKYKIVIEKQLYDIVSYDIDRKNKEVYFYLEEVRKLA